MNRTSMRDRGDRKARPEAAPAQVERVDPAIVLKVLHAVFGETDPDKVVTTVMRLCVAHSGAQRGLVILSWGDSHQVEAEGRIAGDEIAVGLRHASVSAGDLPQTLFDAVARTKRAIMLDDASSEPAYADDEFVRRHGARAMLCMPLLNQDRLVGAVYLENRDRAVFTPARMALLQLLTSAAAISLENTRLHRHLLEQEARARASERESRLILDSLPGFVAELTPSGEVDAINNQIAEYCGGTFEYIRQWASNGIIHPEDLPHLAQVFGAAIASGRPYDIEARIRRFDGVYRWFQVRGLPHRDTGGQIDRWYCLLTDIDARKRAEDAVRASELNLKLIIETIPAAVWSADTDGKAEFLNQNYLEFVGMTAEQANGWGWADAVHPVDMDGLAAMWQRALVSGQPGEAEARLRRHDGEYRWFFFRTNPLRDETGRIVKWYGINTDIEDRKRAEAELRRAHDSFADAQRLSKTGSFITDLVADDHNWSDESYRIFEFERGTPLTVQRIRQTIHPDDVPAFESVIARAMAGGEVTFAFRIICALGRVKHVRGVAHVIERVAGRPLFVGAMQDVTESMVAQAALDQARSQLAHIARVTALGALAASIAHEVNQPLSGIITNAGTCMRMLNAEPPNVEGARETVRRTLRDGDRAAEVISRLRMLFSKREYTLEPLDLNEATREVIALVLSELQRNHVVLHTELAEDLPPVAGDRIQLQQVILNLVRNASDAMAGVDDRPRKLVIRTVAETADQVCVAVRDTGVGLDPKSMDKLFDAFYTTKAGGMGIGLSISRSIVERHQGRLWAEANEGPGATFWFSIPRIATGPVHGAPIRGESAAPLSATPLPPAHPR